MNELEKEMFKAMFGLEPNEELINEVKAAKAAAKVCVEKMREAFKEGTKELRIDEFGVRCDNWLKQRTTYENKEL